MPAPVTSASISLAGAGHPRAMYGLDSPHRTLDLQHQRHPGRLRRPPGGNRRRRDTRLLHPPHGRGRGNALGPRHLRDDGELLAGGRPRRRGGAAGDARVGGQPGGQAEVRGVVDAKGLPVRPTATTSPPATCARACRSSRTRPRPACSSVAASSRPSWTGCRSDRRVPSSSSTPGSPATARPSTQQGLPSTRRLELVSAKPLRSGAVAMHYRRAR